MNKIEGQSDSTQTPRETTEAMKPLAWEKQTYSIIYALMYSPITTPKPLFFPFFLFFKNRKIPHMVYRHILIYTTRVNNQRA